MSEAEAKGPSKNELKKMAKKAEKAAKKQAQKGGGGPGGNAGNPGAGGGNTGGNPKTPPPKPTVSTPPPTPKLMLYNGSEDCTATLKAVWASINYSVNLEVAEAKNLPAGFLPNKKPALIYGNDVVLGGGGNAMCKAIALMGGAAYSFEADEWCEIERTSMRGKAIGNMDSLAAALEASSTGVHLVGDCDSMADICVVATLSKHVDKLDTWPVVVQKYYKVHTQALDRAKAAVKNYVPEPPVSMDDPRLLKVLTQVFLDAFGQVFPD